MMIDHWASVSDLVSSKREYCQSCSLVVVSHITPIHSSLCVALLLLLLLLSLHLYSALSLQIPNALHALCQYLANRAFYSCTII